MKSGIRDSMRRTLEYQGYQFIGAATGQEGLALIERDPPDLVFLDIKMPGMDGLEVLERIKASNPAVPVVMVSGHGTAQNAFEARDKGASGFIEKPFSEPVLLERIEKELAGQSHGDGVSRAAPGSRLEVSDGRQQRRAAGKSKRRSARRRPRMRPCCCRVKAASARSSSRARFTVSARAAASGSCR